MVTHLFPPLFQSCESALVKAAATDCLILLSQQLGPMILRGRIEQHNPQWAHTHTCTTLRGVGWKEGGEGENLLPSVCMYSKCYSSCSVWLSVCVSVCLSVCTVCVCTMSCELSSWKWNSGPKWMYCVSCFNYSINFLCKCMNYNNAVNNHCEFFFVSFSIPCINVILTLL